MVLQTGIVLTATDKLRLNDIIQSLRTHSIPFRGQVDELEREVGRAAVVAPPQVGAEVVTMNSRIVTRDLDSGEAVTFTLVYPGEEGVFDNRLSVLTPLGIQFLGTRVGDVVEWRIPRGVRRLRIERMLYQPEAAGDFHI